MSGDVQARKRREKKKKKEDGSEEVVFQHQHQPPTSPNVIDDLNIHVQKEASTGGGLCAKFVFFILLSLLTTLIGLIITEHRGLTDLDTIDTESRFAQIFEGWVDKSLDHDSHDGLSIEESEENLYDEDESHEHEDEDELSEEKDLDENASDEEDHDEDEDHDDEEDEDEEDEEEESNVQDDTAEHETDEVSNEDEDEDEDDQDEDDVEEDTREYGRSDEEQEDVSSPTKEETEEEDDIEDSVEVRKSRTKIRYPTRRYKSEEIPDDDEESREVLKSKPKTKFTLKRHISEEIPDDEEDSEELPKSKTKSKVTTKKESEEIPDQTKSVEAESAEEKDEGVTEKTDDGNDDDDDDGDGDDDGDHDDGVAEEISAKHKTDKVDQKSKPVTAKVRPEKGSEAVDKTSEEEVNEAENPEEVENSNMVVKFGVGTALLVVAHVVLVRKWRTEKVAETVQQTKTEGVESAAPDLTRRNTIVTPPDIEQIEQDIENVEEEYSEDDEDESEDDSRSKPARAKMRYQELQSTYSHTLTPEWEPTDARSKDDTNYEEEDDEQPEGDEDYDDEISENEDEELLRRLEAKYGKIRQSDEEPDDEEEDDEEEDEEEDVEEDGNEKFNTWKRVKVPTSNVPQDSDSENEQMNWSKEGSGAQAADDFSNITNSDEWRIKEELDRAHQNIANDAAFALTLFNKILEGNPSSPRALYGKAQSLDVLAERKRSNNLLQEAILIYQQVLKTENVPDALFQLAAERCIDRIRFRGIYSQAIAVHKLLIDKFPHSAKFANHLAVTYLTINKINEARKILNETLLKWPDDGFALVHYGFILKTTDNDLEQAIKFLKKGIATGEPGVIDGRFYFHLGDALTRVGKKEDAMGVYVDGVKNRVFLSKYQRSLYNVERLTGKPWWKKEETPHGRFFKNLEHHWKNVRDEGLSILNKQGYFKPESENLRDVGDWKQFELFGRGIKNTKNCKQCPFTCSIIETFREAIECRRGQIKFSVMHPGTHVWPHCGPTNCRLRAHLGLKVPLHTYIRVGEDVRSWEEGKLIIFDDSFEHEVWHNGTSTRLVLIVDFWHPELTKEEKRGLSSI